jgi:hypothetical protein
MKTEIATVIALFALFVVYFVQLAHVINLI